MMTEQEKASLRDAGVDLDGVMARFMNNEALFLKFLKRFPTDKSMEELDAAVKANTVPEAFRAAHTLKGVTGNLGLNTLMALLVPLVEELRVGNGEHLQASYKEIRAEYERLCAVILALN